MSRTNRSNWRRSCNPSTSTKRSSAATWREHQIHPVLDRVSPLADAGEALRRLRDGEQFGKIGLRIG
ncbi:MAG: zinc-binding dehydrogenase [Alicyclobacillus macrosporangiidus]|nr:zinc-binding dehydrogenase [Alicyclobacillus macrosporangiidus]